jgi:protein TonB
MFLAMVLVGPPSGPLTAQCLKKPSRQELEKVHKEPLTVPTPVLMAHAQHRVMPVFPEEARGGRMDGSVMVAVEVNHDGAVTETRLLSGDALFRPIAETAVKQWRFEPFCKKGVPYTVRGVVQFDFRWRGEGSHFADR